MGRHAYPTHPDVPEVPLHTERGAAIPVRTLTMPLHCYRSPLPVLTALNMPASVQYVSAAGAIAVDA